MAGWWVGAFGCVGPWRPSLEHVEVHPPTQVLDLAPYLRAVRAGRWVYRQRDMPPSPDVPFTTYARTIGLDRLEEGNLEGVPLLRLDRYLRPGQQQPEELPDEARPNEVAVIFVELGEPMEPVPPELPPAGTIETRTSVRWYNRLGRLIGTGTLTRRVQIEGFEDVDCPAGRFERCLRLRADLTVRFPWGPSADWTGYTWLSAAVGEVRRVEHLAGQWAFFWFASAHEFELVSYTPAAAAPQPPSLAPKWARAVLHFDRRFSRPRISAVTVDFAPPPPAK